MKKDHFIDEFLPFIEKPKLTFLDSYFSFFYKIFDQEIVIHDENNDLLITQANKACYFNKLNPKCYKLFNRFSALLNNYCNYRLLLICQLNVLYTQFFSLNIIKYSTGMIINVKKVAKVKP